MSEKKIEDIETELEKCIKEKEEYLNGWKRAKADFINYKKEELDRIARAIEYREEEIILEIIVVVDSFSDAKKEIPKDQIEGNEIIKGFLRIKDNLDSLIKKMGLEEIDSLGLQFDPNFHEAVELVEGEGESGTITEEISRGYKRNGRVIKPTKVRVIK